VVVVLLSATGVACTRDDVDMERERRTLAAALAKAPLPAGVRLDHGRAEFDPGCRGFAECADADGSPATYSAPLQIDTVYGIDPAALCVLLSSIMHSRGLRLVTVWRGTYASHDTTSPPAAHDDSSVRPRWIDVDDRVCVTGHLHSAVIVDQAGRSPAPAAHLVLSLPHPDNPGARYLATADAVGRTEDPADRTVPPLPVGNPPLTQSELSYLRARLDTQVLLAADPPVDGIGTGHYTSGRWAIPPAAGIGGLRFRITCTPGDTIRIGVGDATAAGIARGGTRTEDCTAGPFDIVLEVPAPVLTIDITVRQRPSAGSPVPPTRHQPYTVHVSPSTSGP
jgi:hypothetical protein